MDDAEKHQRVADAFRKMVIEETAAIVDAGSAELELSGTDRTPTIDVYDKDPAGLVSKSRCYLRALMAGRVTFTLRKGSSAGRGDLLLDDGTEVPIGRMSTLADIVACAASWSSR
ncbi:MAG: hypothetical protein ACSLFR_10880 [Solirubrobacteraceae bacterium]